jgi:pyruvate formate lyase activating enzyme
MEGIVFNIQRFCVDDGPGIRTTVFLKGCPLRCRWCHNPESHCPESQPFGDEICGKRMTVAQVMDEVKKDAVFYANSGGGLTLSGGEPLLQFDFAYAIAQQAKTAGFHTCVETSGFGRAEDIEKLATVADLFLFDWKLTDSTLHKAYTGVDNRMILENLQRVDAAGAAIILRCPIIPGVNDTQEHFGGIAAVANSLKNILAIEVEPYHTLGISKYQKLGLPVEPHSFRTPDAQQTDQWLEQIRQRTVIPVKKA